MWKAERESGQRNSQKAANTNIDKKHNNVYEHVEPLELENYTNLHKLPRHRLSHERRNYSEEEKKGKVQSLEIEECPHRQEHNKEEEFTRYDIVDLLQQMSSIQRTLQSVSSSCEHCKVIAEEFSRTPHSLYNNLAELCTDLTEFANSHDICVEGIVKRELVHCVLPIVSKEIDETCSLREAALQDLLDNFRETIQNHMTSTTSKVEAVHQSMQSTQNTISTLQSAAKENIERINILARQVEECVLHQNQNKKNSRKSDTNEKSMEMQEKLKEMQKQLANTMTRNELHDNFTEMKEELQRMIYKETTEQLHEPLKVLTEFTANTANVAAKQEAQIKSRISKEVIAHVDAKIEEQIINLFNSYKMEEAKERKTEMRRWKNEVQEYIQQQMSTYTTPTHQQEQEQLILVDVRVAALQKSIHILEGALTSVCGELQEVRTDLRKSEGALNSQLHVLRDQVQRLELYHNEEQREHEQEFGALCKQNNLNSSFYELRDWLTDLEKRIVSQGQLREKLTPIEEQLAELRRFAQASLHESNNEQLEEEKVEK